MGNIFLQILAFLAKNISATGIVQKLVQSLFLCNFLMNKIEKIENTKSVLLD